MEKWKNIHEKRMYVLTQTKYVIFICSVLFLVILGLLRTWELNSTYYSNVIDPWCEPRGFFGMGYICDKVAYTEYLNEIKLLNTSNFTFQLGGNISKFIPSPTIS